MSKSYFINNIDGYLGKELCRQLLETEEQGVFSDTSVVGTKIEETDHSKPPGVKKILWRHKKMLYHKYLTGQDVVVFDTMFGKDITEVKRAIQSYIVSKELEGEKTLILVSHLLSWHNNLKKEKPKEEVKPSTANDLDQAGDADQDQDAQNVDDKDQGEKDSASENDEPVSSRQIQQKVVNDILAAGDTAQDPENLEKSEGNIEGTIPQLEEPTAPAEPIYVPWTDDDFNNRVPSLKYEMVKELEDLVLDFQREGIKTYVVCAGLLYGNGEEALENYMKAAWRQNPLELEYLNEGANLVPTIHIRDLAKFVTKIAELQPEKKYHFAFDETKDRSLKNLVSAISRTAGSGFVKSVGTTSQLPIRALYKDLLSMDFWALPSSLISSHKHAYDFLKEPSSLDQTREIGEEAQADEPPEEDENLIEFDWHARHGFEANGSKVLEEFNISNKHRPLKVYITGDKGSRKSEFAKVLSEHYHIPILNIKDMIARVEEFCNTDLVTDYLEEKEKISALLEDQQQIVRLDLIQINHQNFELSETVKVLFRCLKWRLEENDCKNRGFIFDDPLIGSKDLEVLFCKQKKKLRRIKPKPPKAKKVKKVKIDTESVLIEENPTEQADNADQLEQSQQTNEDKAKLDDDGSPQADELGKSRQELKTEKTDEEGDNDNEDDASGGAEEEQEQGDEDAQDQEQVEEEEEEEGEDAIKNRFESFVPESFVFFEKISKDMKFSNVGFSERIQHISDWCEKQNFETLNIDLGTDSQFEGLESLRLFVERNGRPNNYLDQEDFLKKNHQKYYKTEAELLQQKEFVRKETQQSLKDSQKQQRLTKCLNIVSKIQEKETIKANLDNIPVRKYLMDALNPALTEGLQKIVEINPNDAVDYLAEYLYRRSYDF